MSTLPKAHFRRDSGHPTPGTPQPWEIHRHPRALRTMRSTHTPWSLALGQVDALRRRHGAGYKGAKFSPMKTNRRSFSNGMYLLYHEQRCIGWGAVDVNWALNTVDLSSAACRHPWRTVQRTFSTQHGLCRMNYLLYSLRRRHASSETSGPSREGVLDGNLHAAALVSTRTSFHIPGENADCSEVGVRNCPRQRAGGSRRSGEYGESVRRNDHPSR